MRYDSLRGLLLLVASLAFSACAADAPATSNLVEEAKTVIASLERYAAAGDLDGVMSNVPPEIPALTVGAQLVQGTAEFRVFYGGLFELGDWSFTHDYTGTKVSDDIVELFGVARGTLTPQGGAPSPFENNFLLQLRRGKDGRMKVWRAAFAPLAP